MKQYTTAAEAVSDMHERGFTGDFQLLGSDLLWVQQKIFIRMGLYTVIEYHRFWNPAGKNTDLVLMGIVAVTHNARGILFIDYSTHPGGMPPIIVKKLDELNQKILYRSNIENERL